MIKIEALKSILKVIYTIYFIVVPSYLWFHDLVRRSSLAGQFTTLVLPRTRLHYRRWYAFVGVHSILHSPRYIFRRQFSCLFSFRHGWGIPVPIPISIPMAMLYMHVASRAPTFLHIHTCTIFNLS